MTEEGSDSAIVQTRRRFIQALSSAGVAGAVGSVGAAADTRPTDVDEDIDEVEGTVGGLSFYSPASQLNTDMEPLEDDDVALVRAEPPAFNFQTVDDGSDEPDAVEYPDDIDIPLVSQDTDDPVVGFGTIDFVRDTTGGFRYDNEMFLLNLFDELMGPGSLVAFDESHQFFQGLDDYQAFSAYAADGGYDLRASDDLLTSGGLTFSSTASQLNASGEPLTDPDRILVWAEPTATNIDNEGNDAVEYPDGTDIPLVSRDDNVVGFGTPQLLSDEEITPNNEQFLLNLLADETGESATIVWDDAHDTFWDSSKFGEFATAVGEEDFGFLSSGDDILTSSQPKMTFASTSSLLDEGDDGEGEKGLLFTTETQPAVWAATTATNLDGSEPLVVDDVSPGANTTHAWLFPSVDFQGEVDTITVDYPDTASFDGLDETNIRVLITRELSGGPDMSEISINKDDYTGSTATFDLYGNSTTNIVGSVSVRIDGITNPDTTDYSATITFDGADDQVELTASPALDSEGNPEGDTDTVPYPESFDIPLVGIDEDNTDGAILGVGADLVSDGDEANTANNRTVLLNAWEDLLGGTGTVRYDETHGQNPLSDYSTLETEAEEERGFTVEAITEDFTGALEGADAVMIAGDDSNLTAFSENELNELSTFLSNGGGLFVHDTSYVGGDSTEILNDVFAAVGATFRFNVDQVIDEENNGSEPSVPRTDNYNDEYSSYFGEPTGDLDSADVVAIPSPSTAYTQAELDALSTFTASGGTVLLFDQSDFEGNDETGNLNAIAEELNLAFRFNTDQVNDDVNNAGVAFVPQTMNFNDQFDLFDGFETIGLPDADGVMITTPNLAFQDFELDALSSFVDSGGAVFLFDQSDFGGQDDPDDGFDETANFNAIAEALGLDFRFNSDQVNDEVNNTGSVFDPLTANYDVDPDNPGVFAERENGIGIEFDPNEEYYGEVREVVDGDTFVVEFDEQHTDYGYRDTVRHLGMDTAETGGGNDPFEWFGIPDGQTGHLDTWGQEATDFALDLMGPDGAEAEEEIQGRSVQIRFDEAEPVRGGFGRLLSYMDYDPDSFDADPGTGTFDAEYNLEVVSGGYARVYSSGFGRHDEFAAVEETALADGTGVWEAADFDALDPYRTAFVENAFLPRASSVTTADGPLDGGEDDEDDSGPTPIVRASESATQEAPDDGEYDQYEQSPPLAAVDIDSSVAMFGGQLLDEAYEDGEDDDITDQFDLGEAGNFPLVTNTVELLSDTDGPFLIEGGHGQFGVDGGASLEDLKFYLRHIEGLSAQVEDTVRLRQINDLVDTLPAFEETPRAVILTAPGREYTDAELDALGQFRDSGGAVLLVGSAAPDPAERARLNDIAGSLGTDLRLNDDRIVDEEGPIDDSELLVTADVDSAHGLRMPVHLDREFEGMGVMAALDNVGGEAWTLAAATEGVGPKEKNNPTMTFKIGDRHHIENRGWGSGYPIAFQDADDSALLTQDGEGSFEGDSEVNWVDTDNVVEFTLTEALAAELDSYSSPAAPSMNGDIVTRERLIGPPQIDASFDGPPRDLDGDGLYEDIDGDGEFDIFDVQAFFNTFQTETVQNNAEFFNFNEDDTISIFDVQALFNRL